MEAEELAKEYAREMFHDRTDIDFHPYAEVFDSTDIEDAFKDGRQSVLNIPHLLWEHPYTDVWLAHTPFGDYRVEFDKKHDCYIAYAFQHSFKNNPFKTMTEAKEVAKRDYKNRIMEALGL